MLTYPQGGHAQQHYYSSVVEEEDYECRDDYQCSNKGSSMQMMKPVMKPDQGFSKPKHNFGGYGQSDKHGYEGHNGQYSQAWNEKDRHYDSYKGNSGYDTWNRQNGHSNHGHGPNETNRYYSEHGSSHDSWNGMNGYHGYGDKRHNGEKYSNSMPHSAENFLPYGAAYPQPKKALSVWSLKGIND